MCNQILMTMRGKANSDISLGTGGHTTKPKGTAQRRPSFRPPAVTSSAAFQAPTPTSSLTFQPPAPTSSSTFRPPAPTSSIPIPCTTDEFPPASDNTSSIESESSLGEVSSSTSRQLLEFDHGSFVQSHACSSQISKIFLLHLDASGHSWKTVTQETKKFYWQEFKKKFTWDPTMEELVKQKWESQAALRYSSILSGWRGRGKPLNVPQNIWDSWQREWNTPHFKAICAQASRNRLTEKGGPGSGPSRHTGGSVSMVERSRKMAKKQGYEPDTLELYEITHTRSGKNGKEYIDKRSKDVADRVQALKAIASEPEEASRELRNEHLKNIFLEAVGRDKKGRVYGMGNKAPEMEKKWERNEEQLRSEIWQEMQVQVQVQAQVQEMQNKMQNEMRNEMRKLMVEMGLSFPD